MAGKQKDFLIKLEEACSVKKPIFVNSVDTFAVRDESLCWAKQITVEHAIGRYRLTLQNSEVCEIWIDVDNHDDIPWKRFKKERLIPAVERLNELGIPKKYIIPKVSGRGVHLHVFVRNLPSTIDLTELMSKAVNTEVDSRSLVLKQKIREFGAKTSTGKGFTSYISLSELLKKRKLPVFKEPVYPEITVFNCTPQFLVNLALVKADTEQKKIEKEPFVDYELDGDHEQLLKCPLLSKLKKKAETEKHLTHNERLFVMSQFMCFGNEGRRKIHEWFCSKCHDYSEKLTDYFIKHAMRREYRPFTCRWAKDKRLGCPVNCKGSGGKSPIKFAWTPLTLQELYKEYQKLLVLQPEDFEVIDILLATMLDTRVEGELVWLFLVAPSSWGKTVLLRSIHDPAWSILIDTITDKTFISGKTYIDKVTKEEKLVEGLLPKLHNKTLICKDYTVQLMQGEKHRLAIFAQLRGIYDKYYSQAFGSIDYSKIPEHWKHVKMGFIAGCTLFIDRYSTLNVILGERFLKVRMTEPDRVVASKKAREIGRNKDKLMKRLIRKVKRFLANVEIKFEDPPEELGNALDYLAEAIVHIRKPVTKTQTAMGTVIYEYEEQTELGTRLVQQLQKLGWMLQCIRKTGFDVNIYKTLVRVGFDTLPPERIKIVLYLYNQKKPVAPTKIRNALGWGHYRITHHLKDLEYIGIVHRTDSLDYYLDDYIRKCLTVAFNPLQHGTTDLKQGVPYKIDHYNNKKNNTILFLVHRTMLKDMENCEDFASSPCCRRCPQQSTCGKPAFRHELMRFVLRSNCACHKCARPAPRYPMTFWCRKCYRADKPLFQVM